MKLKIIFLSLLLITGCLAYSQDNNNQQTQTTDNAVTDAFPVLINIESATTTPLFKGGMNLIIQHRFTKIDKLYDLFGIYGGSNIRMAFSYGLTDKIMLGFSSEKAGHLQEFFGKYAIIQQTESGKIPVSVSYYANFVIDATEGKWGAEYKTIDRFSTFHQMIVSKKFSDKLSVMFAPSYMHVNKVDSVYANDAMGVTIGARVKPFGNFTFLFEFNQGVFMKDLKYYQKIPKPGIAFGLEIGTNTHAFQIFATTYDKLIMQKNFMENSYEPDKNLMFGFNVSVRL